MTTHATHHTHDNYPPDVLTTHADAVATAKRMGDGWTVVLYVEKQLTTGHGYAAVLRTRLAKHLDNGAIEADHTRGGA